VTLGQVAAGALRAETGQVTLHPPGAEPIVITRRDLAQRAGIGYVPEDRRAAGFVGALSIAENITMAMPAPVGRVGNPLRNLTTAGRRSAVARPLAESLHIAASSLRQPVSELSGGNQQKVTVARALAGRPSVLVAITPTRGVDVASKDVLLGALRAAGARGLGVLVATDDLDDLEICDRVLVLVRGRVTAEFDQTTAGSAGSRSTDFSTSRSTDRAPVDRATLIAAIEGISTEGKR
jgi:simple sugar transport system ATP-binding protein